MSIRLAVAIAVFAPVIYAAEEAKTVHFPSEDGKTTLVGFLFEPHTPGRHPAIVLMHGRAGAYSSLADGKYTAATLSKRHKAWGAFWAERGYVALLVDSFGPRGYSEGFPKGSYDERPAEVSEQTVRPFDAYGALRYLRGRRDVISDRIGLQGWSNGGMATLVTISDESPGIDHPTRESGFRAALALYPGCGMKSIHSRFVPYAPLLMLIAGDDEEVSPKKCEELAKRSKSEGAPLDYVVYPGAAHNFDDPGKKKQSVPENRNATEDAFARAERFFGRELQ